MMIDAERLRRRFNAIGEHQLPAGSLGKLAHVTPEVLKIIETYEAREFEAMGLTAR